MNKLFVSSSSNGARDRYGGGAFKADCEHPSAKEMPEAKTHKTRGDKGIGVIKVSN
jgi:hypothetical protein